MNQIPKIEEVEMTEWQAICRKLNLRDETVDGTDEQGTIRNHYLKWFIPKQTLHQQLQKARQDGYNAGLADGADKPLLAIDSAYEKGYSRGLEVGEIETEEAVQKARQDWLREEIVWLEGMKETPLGNVLPEFEHTRTYINGWNKALQTITDRYHSELDQDKK